MSQPIASPAPAASPTPLVDSSAEEIMEALERGGFDFKATGWKTGDRLRMVALSLAKNTKYFHKLPNNTFGLWEWYPEIQKRQAKAADGEDDAQAEEEQD